MAANEEFLAGLYIRKERGEGQGDVAQHEKIQEKEAFSKWILTFC